MSKRVFLGGTCNNSEWRASLISLLNPDKISYFNPVVPDWTDEAAAQEIKERENCDYCLYVITPRMEGVYSIAEVADDSNKRPNKTIFCFLEDDITFTTVSFSKTQLKSLNAVAKLVTSNGGTFCSSLEEVAKYLNEK